MNDFHSVIRETKSDLLPLPARKIHAIVLVMVSVFVAIGSTFPLSMYRVAQKGDGWGEKSKVKGIYVKSLDEAKKPIASDR